MFILVMAFDGIKKMFGKTANESEYVEIDLGREAK